MNDFYSEIYELVLHIPKGKVTSYGAIAIALGKPKGARLVGYAMNFCDKRLPAHRVVNRQGMLTGKMHFGTGEEMANRLRADGIEVIGDQIVNFEKHFWDPSQEWKSI
ncbi:MAG: methylated-DNA-[protein]-cysteine S-methyltransferase [Bacteroidota bacterium]